jgi:hypothetical protein
MVPLRSDENGGADMTALASRRKPIFNRRGSSQRQVRKLALAVAFLAVAGTSFTVGVQVGAGSPDGNALKSLIAANLN